MRGVSRLALVLLIAAPFGAAIAQSPRSLSLQVDNDAFNFWTMPWNRPDGEYTSGVHITYSGGKAFPWLRHFLGDAEVCTTSSRRCQTARAELGQDIYTPLLSSDNPPPAGSRPNAGWLYVSQTARALTAEQSDELTLTLGVTGPPSLGRVMQTFAHSAAPAFNRPTDWSRQIGFEPGAIVRFERRTRAYASEGPIALDVIPSIAASAGNVLVAADAGVRTRAGWNLRHPWLPQSGPTEIVLVGGVSTRFVARDLFLDGNTFGATVRVGHRPLVYSGELGIEVRIRALSLAYRAQTSSRAYDAGPQWHPWSSLVAGVTYDR